MSKYEKQLFFAFCILMVFSNFIQTLLIDEANLVAGFYESIGASVISIPVWVLVGGFIIFPIVHAIINIIQPSNNLKFSKWNQATFGLLIGVVLKLVGGVRF